MPFSMAFKNWKLWFIKSFKVYLGWKIVRELKFEVAPFLPQWNLQNVPISPIPTEWFHFFLSFNILNLIFFDIIFFKQILFFSNFRLFSCSKKGIGNGITTTNPFTVQSQQDLSRIEMKKKVFFLNLTRKK